MASAPPVSRDPLDDSIQFLKGVGPARAADFARLGVMTVRDLLFRFPRDLADRSEISSVAEAPEGVETAFLVRPVEVKDKEMRRGRLRHLTVIRFADDTGELEAVWFNSPWIAERIGAGPVLLHGRTKREYGRLKLEHPRHERVAASSDDALHIGRIVPVYPCTGSLTQEVWLRCMKQALDSRLDRLAEVLPAEVLVRRGFAERSVAVREMHFPTDAAARDRARTRLAYEECLLLQLAVLAQRRHARHDRPGREFRFTPELDTRIRRLFPFRLTAAQERCVREIAADMASPLPMHRLLQGDVGSGKTAVATYVLLAAIANGAQACLLAPTSLLARQHKETVDRFLAASRHARVQVALLTGGVPAAEARSVRERLAAGMIDLLVATHAALGPEVVFRDLGLVVIDEQHKFGVRQRAGLVAKGVRPDLLVMTATPIPRSLALTFYGDLDVSVLDELPPGRKPVRTTVVSRQEEDRVWAAVRRELSQGRQAFIVSPQIGGASAGRPEEEESSEEGEPEAEVRGATEAFEQLSAGALKGWRLALLHGRMGREEQRETMESLRAGRIDALVSTVVIEVGVDIPNATVMVVLHAERFGLAQLHQLRGRIGRGGEAGQFWLLADGSAGGRRLEALARTQDGFELAEEDLRLRGPGDLLGTRQHGLPDLRVADLMRDLPLLREARADAAALLEADPDLQQAEHRALARELSRFLADRADPGTG